jgi:hypothetical protein
LVGREVDMVWLVGGRPTGESTSSSASLAQVAESKPMTSRFVGKLHR